MEGICFNRGRTNTHLFPDVEKLVGDRNDDVEALRGRRWDAVIDNSGYTPDQVRLTTEVLRDATDQYLFTSTRGVYRDFTVAPQERLRIGISRDREVQLLEAWKRFEGSL